MPRSWRYFLITTCINILVLSFSFGLLSIWRLNSYATFIKNFLEYSCLQCCVRFCCTAQWISHMYVCVCVCVCVCTYIYIYIYITIMEINIESQFFLNQTLHAPLDSKLRGLRFWIVSCSCSVHYGGGGLVAQSCLTLCNPMDFSPPGSSVHGISQARVLEWIAISFFRGSSQPRDQTWISCIASRFFTDWATRETQCPL